MRIEFQGEGSYEYKCDKPDCWFCEHFNPSPYIPAEPKPWPKNRWHPDDVKWLIENYNAFDLPFLMAKFEKSRQSITNLICDYRKKGYTIAKHNKSPRGRVIINSPHNHKQKSKKIYY